MLAFSQKLLEFLTKPLGVAAWTPAWNASGPPSTSGKWAAALGRRAGAEVEKLSTEWRQRLQAEVDDAAFSLRQLLKILRSVDLQVRQGNTIVRVSLGRV